MLLPALFDRQALVLSIELAWVAGVVLWLLHDRRSPAGTLAWILVLALLPGVGVPVYLFLGPRRLERRTRRKALAHALAEPTRRALESAQARVAPELAGLMRLAGSLGWGAGLGCRTCTGLGCRTCTGQISAAYTFAMCWKHPSSPRAEPDPFGNLARLQVRRASR